jgi:hypothetical protein
VLLMIISMRHQGHNPHATKRTKGQGSLELIPSLIMICLLMAAIAGLCVMLYLQNIAITVAREGARFASVNPELGMPATQAAGRTAVQSKISQMLNDAIGITPTSVDIGIDNPNGTYGERMVKVRLNLAIPNPVVIPDLSQGFTSDSGGRLLATIPLSAEAAAHYEE